MAAPTFIQEAETAWNTDANTIASVATASFNVLAGDVLVACGMTSDNSVTLAIAGGSLTWANPQTVGVASYCRVHLWTATVDVDKSMTVTFTRTGATTNSYGGNVFTFRGSSGLGASNKTNVASGAPTLNLLTTQANSAIVVFSADWVPVDGASRTWRPNAGTLTEKTYFFSSTSYTTYGGYHADAGAIATYAVGLSAPGAQKYSIVAVEVKGTAAAGPPAGSLGLLGVGR